MTLAQRFQGEIINGDALQLYEGLPIATNKLPANERQGIPHHLLGCIKIHEEPWTVTHYRRRANQVAEDIRSRGKLPILVGGTNYYVQSLLLENAILNEEGSDLMPLDDMERAWPILRASTEEMMEELKRVDPVMASKWHPKDRRKIRRSLEIWLTTGNRASELYEAQKNNEAQANDDGSARNTYEDPSASESKLGTRTITRPLIFWIHADSEELQDRYHERTTGMLQSGLLAEVESMHLSFQDLLSKGRPVDQSYGVWIAIGYKELLPYISAAKNATSRSQEIEALQEEGTEAITTATRQYAKNQVKWIRNRLLHSLLAEDKGGSMFVLEGTQLPCWKSDVEDVATGLTEKYMQGVPLPCPLEMSDTAKTLLQPPEKANISARYCDVCQQTLMTDAQWDKHMKSKRHRRAARPKVDWRKLYPKQGSSPSTKVDLSMPNPGA